MEGQHLYILTFQVLEADAPVVTGALENTYSFLVHRYAMSARLLQSFNAYRVLSKCDYIQLHSTSSDSNSTSSGKHKTHTMTIHDIQTCKIIALFYRAKVDAYQHYMSLAATLQERSRPLTKPLLLKSNRTWHKHHADSLWKANQIITHGQTLEIWNLLGWPRQSECHNYCRGGNLWQHLICQ